MTTAAPYPGRRLLTRAEVLCKMGVTNDWFTRARPGLEAEHGFPPPVPGFAYRWDEAAIDAWLDAQPSGPRRPPAAANDAGGQDAPDEDWTDTLRARARRLANAIEGGG